MDILIIKPKWVDHIFDYNKLWEIRGSSTSKTRNYKQVQPRSATSPFEEKEEKELD